MVDRIMSVEYGTIDQQFVPWLSEITSASREAICSAETISPRAAPA